MVCSHFCPACPATCQSDFELLSSLTRHLLQHRQHGLQRPRWAAPSATAKVGRRPEGPPRAEWIKEVWCVHNGIRLGHKKERNRAICSNTDRRGAQLVRGKTGTVCCLLYVEKHNKLMNVTKKKQTHRSRELVFSGWRTTGAGVGGERHKLPSRRQAPRMYRRRQGRRNRNGG